jgi:hypothetical protein
MKYLFSILFIAFVVVIIVTPKPELKTTQKTCTIDSVEYHGMGHDNISQIDPYWKIHLKELNMWSRTHFNYTKGDSIDIYVKQLKK